VDFLRACAGDGMILADTLFGADKTTSRAPGLRFSVLPCCVKWKLQGAAEKQFSTQN